MVGNEETEVFLCMSSVDILCKSMTVSKWEREIYKGCEMVSLWVWCEKKLKLKQKKIKNL